MFTTERPGVRATELRITVTSTHRGVLIEGELAHFEPSGRKARGPRVRDAYRQTRPLSYTELLAIASWWTEARMRMLPDAPVVEPGMPIRLDEVAAQQPGSLPGEGKGRGAVRSGKSDRKADPI
jgi:hypothetical protein